MKAPGRNACGRMAGASAAGWGEEEEGEGEVGGDRAEESPAREASASSSASSSASVPLASSSSSVSAWGRREDDDGQWTGAQGGGGGGEKTIRDARGTGGRRARTSSSGSASALAPAASSRGSGSSERSNESFSTESGDASRGPSRASFLLSAGPGRALPSPRERLGDSGIADTVSAPSEDERAARIARRTARARANARARARAGNGEGARADACGVGTGESTARRRRTTRCAASLVAGGRLKGKKNQRAWVQIPQAGGASNPAGSRTENPSKGNYFEPQGLRFTRVDKSSPFPPPLRFVELPDDVPRDGVAQERRHGHLE